MKNQTEHGKIRVKLPCKCYMEVEKSSLNIKTNKYFMNYIKCKKHNISGKDVLLKKVNDYLYVAIIDPKKERKIFKQEDQFFADMYNKKLFKCPDCDTDIYGKNMLSVNNYKKTYWEIDFQCPECKLVSSYRIDSRDIV
jgi:hypothetical protein